MTDHIKDTLKRMPYGFYAITTKAGQDVNAMVANWVMQTSFSPRLLTVAIQKDSYTRGLIEQGGVFAVNLFRQEGRDALMPFTKGRAKRPDKMENARYTSGPQTGCPVLEGAAAYLECKVVAIHDTGGDHELIVGEVVDAGVLADGAVGDTLTLPDLGWSYAG